MPTRDRILEIARGFVGCKEDNGTHKPIIDAYNEIRPLPRGYRMSYTDAWCAAFVSAVAHIAGALDIIPAECSCIRMIDGFKTIGEWEESDRRTPAPADIIFYDWEDSGAGDNAGTPNHVGIVEAVADGVITVIEGNYSNCVKRRTIAVDGRYIRGYGLPRYSDENPAEANVEPPAPPSIVPMTKEVETAVDTIARAIIRGGWGTGDARKENLYKVIQGRVNEILL